MFRFYLLKISPWYFVQCRLGCCYCKLLQPSAVAASANLVLFFICLFSLLLWFFLLFQRTTKKTFCSNAQAVRQRRAERALIRGGRTSGDGEATAASKVKSSEVIAAEAERSRNGCLDAWKPCVPLRRREQGDQKRFDYGTRLEKRRF